MDINPRALLATLLIGTLLFPSFPALAEGLIGGKEIPEENPLFALDAGIKTEAIYDSNVFQVRYFPEDDFYFSLQPRIGLHGGYHSLGADLVYQPRFLFFTKHYNSDGLKDILQDLRFASTVFSSQYFDLEVKDTLDNVKTNLSNPGTPNNLSLQNRVEGKGIFTFDFDPRTQTQETGGVERRDIQDPGEDYLRYGGSAQFTRELSEYFTLAAKETIYETDYDRSWVTDYLSFYTEAGVRYNFSERLAGGILGTHTYLVDHGQPNSSNFGFRVDGVFEASETTHINAEAKQEYGKDTTANTTKSTNFLLGFTQQLGPRTLLIGEATWLILNIPSAGIPKDQLLGGRLGLSYDITDRFRAGLRYEIDKNVGPTSFNDFTAHRGIFELSYEFGRLVNIF